MTYRDSRQRAFMFTSAQMSLDELIDAVGSSSLLLQVRDDERLR